MARFAVAGFALAAACAYACGGSRLDTKPVPTVASTTASSAALDDIRDAWDRRANGADELRLKIERFLRQYPDDGATQLVHVY